MAKHSELAVAGQQPPPKPELAERDFWASSDPAALFSDPFLDRGVDPVGVRTTPALTDKDQRPFVRETTLEYVFGVVRGVVHTLRGR